MAFPDSSGVVLVNETVTLGLNALPLTRTCSLLASSRAKEGNDEVSEIPVFRQGLTWVCHGVAVWVWGPQSGTGGRRP